MKGVEEATQVMEQGRVQTLRDLHEAWKVDGINAAFTVVERIAHEADKARATMLQFLQLMMQGKQQAHRWPHHPNAHECSINYSKWV